MMDLVRDRRRLVERRAQVARDLAELEEQAAEGEVEADAADRLRTVYREELDEIDAALADLGPEPQAMDDVPSEAPGSVMPDGGSRDGSRRPGFSTKAALIAAGALAVITGLIVWAGGGLSSDASGTQAGAAVTVPAGPIDIAAMSTDELEASLEAFPESAEVRIELADRHLEEGDQRSAFDHYLAVAESDAPPLLRSRALARVGYLAYASGQVGYARESLEEALSLNEDNTEAALYLGYVLLNALDEPEAAIPYLERALTDPAMPVDIVEDINEMLAEARAATGG